MSHSHGNVSSGNDPRQPLAAKPYTPRPVAPEDLPVDYSGFIAVILGVSGVMFRYKICSWLAIIFCAQSLANMRNLENDLKQISMAMMERKMRNTCKPNVQVQIPFIDFLIIL
ncbi:protein Asterix isoform X1 [Brassica napus]|uniref:protein Asterix isoform X1 n=1 Tax=Brassica napus TaxID=3708 RepID=UPI002079B2E6|nr:protein Asterix isoform X1 [Brassica napus]